MKNLNYIGISKASSNQVKRIGFICPVGSYVNSCNISDLDSLYLNNEGDLVHDVTFIESDLEIYEDLITKEYQYKVVK